MLSIVNHCSKVGVVVSVFTYDPEVREGIVDKVAALEASNIRVIMWVGSDAGIGTVMTEAYRRGLLDPAKGAMWVVGDGVGPAAVAGSLAGDSDAPTEAISGFIRILPVGGNGDLYERVRCLPLCCPHPTLNSAQLRSTIPCAACAV